MRSGICTVIFLLCFGNTLVTAQNRIYGTVQDEGGQPVVYANVLVLAESDNQLIKGGITDEKGAFDLTFQSSVPVQVKINSIGFSEYTSLSMLIKGAQSLGNLILKEEAEALSEVVLTASRPLFEQKIDRTVVNVRSSVTNAGNNALNVLAKSPTVSVNRTTNQISMLGKTDVLVMIDDKQLRMEMSEVISFLESMPSDNIDTIELITAPPARYDAQGIGGIINITTFRNKGQDLVGSLSANAGYGETGKYGTSLNLGYTKNKWYLFGNLSANYNNEIQKVPLWMEYNTPDEQLTSDLYTYRESATGLYSGEVGFDYEISEKTIIGGVASLNISDWKMDAYSITDVTSTVNPDYTELVRSYEENQLFRTLYNLNFRHRFSEKSQLTFDYDNIYLKRKNPTEYDVEVSRENMEPERNSFISGANTPLGIHVFKADFDARINDKVRIEAGTKTTLSDFKNRVRVANLVDGEFVDDPDYTDVFRMDERIYAGYLSSDWQVLPQLLLKTGVRYEYYDLHLFSDNRNDIVNRAQGNLFPSVYINYKKSDAVEWNLSYVQRIERPGFLNLAPYFYFFNQKTLFTGNPELIPSISNQYKIDFKYKTLQIGAQLTDSSDPIFNFQPELEGDANILVFRPKQGAGSKLYTVTMAFPINFTAWWTSRYNLLGNHQVQKPIINGEQLTLKNNSYTISSVQSFKLGAQWDAEITAAYNSTQYEGIFRVEPRPSVDMGIRKKFTSGASLSFNMNDVFNSSSEWNIISNTNRFETTYNWLFDAEGPVFRLGFTMPLGNNELRQRKKRESGSEEEQERLN